MSRQGLSRHNARRDDVEPEIKWVLQHVGCIVYPLSVAGVPDLLVSCPWNADAKFNYLIECKDAEKGYFKPAQIDFNATWLGQRGVATNFREALDILDAPGLVRVKAVIGYESEMQKPESKRFKKKS